MRILCENGFSILYLLKASESMTVGIIDDVVLVRTDEAATGF